MVFPFQPMPLSRRAAPFDHPEWVFEVKHDGFRAIAYVKAGHCELVSRRGYVYKRFLALVAEARRTSMHSTSLNSTAKTCVPCLSSRVSGI